MDNELKIDLDMDNKEDIINLLSERLKYMHDLNFFQLDNIKEINLLHKTSYAVKIELFEDITEELIVILQLALGSDYRKEINSLINFKKLNMRYWNRLFTAKRYKDGSIITADEETITENVFRVIAQSNEVYKS